MLSWYAPQLYNRNGEYVQAMTLGKHVMKLIDDWSGWGFAPLVGDYSSFAHGLVFLEDSVVVTLAYCAWSAAYLGQTTLIERFLDTTNMYAEQMLISSNPSQIVLPMVLFSVVAAHLQDKSLLRFQIELAKPVIRKSAFRGLYYFDVCQELLLAMDTQLQRTATAQKVLQQHTVVVSTLSAGLVCQCLVC